MTGITRKMLYCFFPVVVPEKTFLGGGRTNANQQKHTKHFNLKFDKKLCQYDDNCI